MGAVLVMVYIPLCYNKAMDILESKSAYEFHGSWVGWVNSAIVCAFLLFLASMALRLFL